MTATNLNLCASTGIGDLTALSLAASSVVLWAFLFVTPGPGAFCLDHMPYNRITGGEASSAVVHAMPSTSIIE